MNLVPENPYEDVPYPTFPRIETHPDRLAAVATLFGMEPAPVTRCRMLEIGCGDATNLIAMAYALPGSRFTGVDLARGPLETGQALTQRAGLNNISLLLQDLRWIGPPLGEFDYIVAHGVYSWVPPDVRERLLAVCSERLAPRGVVLISYNTLPGRQVRQMLREMLLFHTGEIRDPAARISEARRYLEFFRKARSMAEEWKPIIDQEIRMMLERGDGGLYHDDLAPVNDPVYFHEFAAHAARHGLKYLGEAHPREMIDHEGSLGWIGDDLLKREQHLDYLKGRRFRETLLCHDSVVLNREPAPEVMDRFWFTSSGRVRVKASDATVQRVTEALDAVYPLPVAFEELVPYAGDEESARAILFTLVRGGFAELHVHDFPCEDSVTARPRASALARIQAGQGDEVANLCQQTVELDETAQRLIVLLDGSRTVEQAACEAGVDAEAAGASIEWMAGAALLEG